MAALVISMAGCGRESSSQAELLKRLAAAEQRLQQLEAEKKAAADSKSPVLSGLPGQRLTAGPVAVTAQVELQGYYDQIDPGSITHGAAELDVRLKVENITSNTLVLAGYEGTFQDRDGRTLDQKGGWPTPPVIEPDKSQEVMLTTSGYPLDPESTALRVTLKSTNGTLAGPFTINTAQTLSPPARERERKRREIIAAMEARSQRLEP